jgi:hypothetical protein
LIIGQIPEDDTEMDGEEMEALHEEIEADFDAGDTIRSKLIPHAVAWWVPDSSWWISLLAATQPKL